MYEDAALRLYMAKTGFRVEPTGLNLFPCGFMGATLDGILYPPGMEHTRSALEIKCPYTHRDRTIPEMLKSKKNRIQADAIVS